MKKLRNRSDILNAGKVKFHEIHIPEWDDEEGEFWVRLKGWTLAEADDIMVVVQRQALSGSVADYSRQICAVSIVDENGDLMFGDGEDGPRYAELGNLSPEGMMRVRDEALAFNLPKMTNLQQRIKKAADALVKPTEGNSKN